MAWVQHRGLWVSDGALPATSASDGQPTQVPIIPASEDGRLLTALKELSAPQNAVLARILETALGRPSGMTLSAPVDPDTLYKSLMLSSRYGLVVPIANQVAFTAPSGYEQRITWGSIEGYDMVILGTFRLGVTYHSSALYAYILMDGKSISGAKEATLVDDWSLELLPWQYLLGQFARKVFQVAVGNGTTKNLTALVSFLSVHIERNLHMSTVLPMLQRGFEDIRRLVAVR